MVTPQAQATIASVGSALAGEVHGDCWIDCAQSLQTMHLFGHPVAMLTLVSRGLCCSTRKKLRFQ